jgi:hypothetical protein
MILPFVEVLIVQSAATAADIPGLVRRLKPEHRRADNDVMRQPGPTMRTRL